MVRVALFAAATALLSIAAAVPAVRPSDVSSTEASQMFSDTDDYPITNQGNVITHDPNILEYNDNLYMFKGGVHITIMKAQNISGPWTEHGTVLDADSVIDKVNRTRPWAPTAIHHNGKFYCFYSVSYTGTRDSSIGIATTDDIEGGAWTDHGALINTVKGKLSHVFPYTESNAIDPSFITDQKTGQPYLVYGSYWHGIWQVPLTDDLLSVADPEKPDAENLAYLPEPKVKPQEGSFMSYHEPYYYTWFSHGRCCDYTHNPPKIGQEYEIQMGRSKDVRGPFVDKSGKKLTEGGGTVVYGSNHGVVYAPGGPGVLPANGSRPDILYYHYLNTSIGLAFKQAHLGWSYLDYEDGWPVAKESLEDVKDSASSPRVTYSSNLLIITFISAFLWISH
ncbi:hypothetical protein ASPWEDRAFT_41766 [Aspergillus wentii DTO 134E9]|uniref:Arabinan endo-1,5-alpha-L-arabinosidase n=1 Tax=Aspergillus wentii DTO 134E9 TaxID=1073089 RepID=A0A1L9RG26_ASPWE|nr:uncharacterized protein ASPWEDRAFT_41766 [Aspergillus wentii DTO 134E9]KAI9925644.1 hypothetical protein MW887_006027 [Aspergillus wentii]OJJ33882.1 hypothetical protein ASPWEDRAFT_41766 [Aspergillus wentii DTO 134E9]